MSIFDRPEFNRALFYPRDDTTPPPENARDLFVEVEGARIHVRCHDTSAKVRLLLFHGNGEVVSDYDDYAARYASAGAALAIADYRGYGASSGEPTLRSAVMDARAVAEAVRDERPLVIMGRSLGGVPAHELYARPIDGMVGVVLESAFTDLAGLVRRRGIEPPTSYSDEEHGLFEPKAKLALGRLPLLVLHGEADTLIRPSEAHVAHAEAGSAEKELVLIPGHGHNDVSYAARYWQALARFLARWQS